MKSNNLNLYCITHKYFKFLENLNLKIIVGGSYYNKSKFPKKWLLDKTKKNIAKKNINYETLTSIYWIWKNEIKKYNKNDWIGICHYRRFWLKKKLNKKIYPNNLKRNLLNFIPSKDHKFNAFVLSPQNVSGHKLVKMLKKTKRNIIKNPAILFNKKLHTINLHFDMFHIHNGLIKAASVMPKKDRSEFLNYINTETKFFPFNLFILKKDKFNLMCNDIFKWIFKCEKFFNLKKLKGYGQTRIFAFIIERYISYWIIKNSNYKILPGVFIDPLGEKPSKVL